ncbi:hypothetical protein QQF64_020072 [Cirrhinus molitorella]|uniref:Uncharacterized protein n=1 Tax=Cirrhinus molitorella TaxID=172907 RepID=A0ABR3LHB7_9TELE
MFGMTHVVAIDGFSSQIVAYNTMPVKNNLIYQNVYRFLQLGLSELCYHGRHTGLQEKGYQTHWLKVDFQQRFQRNSVVADMYQQDVGSCLTFGTDPVTCEEDKARAEQDLAERYPDITLCLDQAVNHDFTPFKEAILHLMNVTRHYS